MSTVPVFDASAFEVAKQVTIPFHKIEESGVKHFLKFLSAFEKDTSGFSERMRRSKKDEEGKTDQSQDPVDIAKVLNLATGQTEKLLAHSVLKSQLMEAYPNDEYVGKMFQIEKKEKQKGKRYFEWEILELKLKGKTEDAPEHKGKK